MKEEQVEVKIYENTNLEIILDTLIILMLFITLIYNNNLKDRIDELESRKISINCKNVSYEDNNDEYIFYYNEEKILTIKN